MKLALVVVMMLHGFAHTVGFVGAWHLNANIPYKTTLLSGRVDLGFAGIRMVGILWLIVGLSFILAALTALASHPSWMRATMVALGASTALCLAELPQTRIGLGLNAALALALAVIVIAK